jgi:hypothetical protein
MTIFLHAFARIPALRRGASILALATLLLAAFSLPARTLVPIPGMLSGVVYLDRDGDGRRDPGEPGLRDVKVSNGRELVRTDAQGRYALTLQAGDTVFVIKPPGLALPRRDDGMPDFWKHHFPEGSPPLRYGGIAPVSIANGDFALLPAAAGRDAALDVLVFGDPQPKRAVDVDYYARDIVAPLRAAPQAALGLSLGDIVDDDLSLYPAMNRVTAQLQRPWLHLPGNHDLDFDATRDEDSLLTYRSALGPDTYAWEEAAASFVLLDDVVYQPGASPAYVGGLREEQFAFLQAWLATLPTQRPLVLAAHIPLHDPAGRETFRRADRERLFALLQRFERVLLLTSHAHAQRHHFHGAVEGWHGAQPLHEYVVGAACGGFWSGAPDAQGIPDARMNDGTPNGYARLRIDATGYRLRWYAARDTQDTRIALHAPRVLRRGAYPAFAVSANVYMGMADTRVEYRIDQGEWRAMTRAERPDPALLAINADDDRRAALREYDRAVEAAVSQHLWRGMLPTDLDEGEHRIEVRAFDRWDGELRAETSYRLETFAESP